MANSNEQSLLSYLQDLHIKTHYELIKEVSVHNYWASGEYKYDSENFGVITNDQIDYFITNAENRIKPLRFRLKWIESQIAEVENLMK